MAGQNVTDAGVIEFYTSLFILLLVGLLDSATVDFLVKTVYVLLSCPSIQYLQNGTIYSGLMSLA
jgi:hypothetical protein